MSKWGKLQMERVREIEQTRRILKQFLYALHTSEGFGEMRLLRVLLEWSEVYDKVNDPKNNANDEMMLIDSLLDKVVPSRLVTKSVGYEPLKDKKGRKI